MKTKSKYKGVCCVKRNGKQIWWDVAFNHKNVRYHGVYKDERQAALQYDLYRIECGLEPVNILKRKARA